jgi:hypothetical protein
MSPPRFEDRPVAGMWPVAKRFLMSFPIRSHVLLRVPPFDGIGGASAFSQCAPQSRQAASGQLKSRLLGAHYDRARPMPRFSKADAMPARRFRRPWVDSRRSPDRVEHPELTRSRLLSVNPQLWGHLSDCTASETAAAPASRTGPPAPTAVPARVDNGRNAPLCAS